MNLIHTIFFVMTLTLVLFSATASSQAVSDSDDQATVAREWTEATLFAIRRDLARPTVHARNLFHLSASMYDAWALYDATAIPVFMQSSAAPECQFSSVEKNALLQVISDANDKKLAQQVAVAHAAWNVLNYRFKNSRQGTELLAHFVELAMSQGLDKSNELRADQTHAAVIGLRVANCIIATGALDLSNEANDYANINYVSINPALDPIMEGNPSIVDVNRWQPLQLVTFIDQSGNVTDTPTFIGADWGMLEPFSLTTSDKSIITIDGIEVPVWLDPGRPPMLSDDPNTNTTFLSGNALVVMWSAQLDPADETTIDISPGGIGNLVPLSELGDNQADILSEYDAMNGGLGKSTGHALNPHTGQPYPSNRVRLGDYTRVLAEFWADGPESETPPGHWFSLYNQVVAGHPKHDTKLEGKGEPVDALEYDILAYLALGGAMHDSAIAAWSVKRAYDYVRPVSAIRYMASLGQSTDTSAVNYHVHGMPLVSGSIETVQRDDALAGDNNENVGKIKGRAWRGPLYIAYPSIDVAGVDWILLENWWPYQRPTFVTPPFAGYVSGHSTFSRAAAEVLTQLTGDPFFPGGYAEFVAEKDTFLVFEKGPSADVRLQWATYRDAADQTSLSRIWGGIHPPADDIVGRRMGEEIGIRAWQRVAALAKGSIDGSMSGAVKSSSGLGCSLTTNNPQSPMLLMLCLAALAQIIRRHKKKRIAHF